MAESRHVVFDESAGRWLCRHCGRSEHLPAFMPPVEDVIALGGAFVSVHAVCPGPNESVEARTGESTA